MILDFFISLEISIPELLVRGEGIGCFDTTLIRWVFIETFQQLKLATGQRMKNTLQNVFGNVQIVKQFSEGNDFVIDIELHKHDSLKRYDLQIIRFLAVCPFNIDIT